MLKIIIIITKMFQKNFQSIHNIYTLAKQRKSGWLRRQEPCWDMCVHHMKKDMAP
jgi:hypothetical protein